MEKTRSSYRPEYTEQAVVPARARRSVEDSAEEIEPSEQTMRDRLFQAQVDAGE